MRLPKIIVIVGPTASGKTELALALAKKFNGEIISADSRQVYKEMNIGTAKPAGEWREGGYIVDGVPHYLMDIIGPAENFSVADFKKMAIARINDILSRGKLPIMVGGTGLYIWAVVENLDIPTAVPAAGLRARLEKKSPQQLVAMLTSADPATANKIDLKNPRRVLRALEVFLSSGQSFYKQRTKSKPFFAVLQIGISLPPKELEKRINERVDEQNKGGLVEETGVLAKKYGWELPAMSGIGYRQIGAYLRGEATLNEAIATLKRDTRRYAKRQMTWFKRDKKIIWVKKADLAAVGKLVGRFLQE